jgi:hypothetical protein
MRLVALLVMLMVPAPAAAAVRVAAGGQAYSLAASRGMALAVVDSGDAAQPFDVVRSTGRGASILGGFGGADAEFPEVAAGEDGRAFVGWATPISGGNALRAAPVAALDELLPEVASTGPGRLAVGAGVLLAYPDRDGDAALSVLATDRRVAAGEPVALTTTAPQRRHLPLGVAAVVEGALVLDLIQERDRTELRVIGPGAPSGPVFSVPALRHIPARLAVGSGRIAVGYLVGGRAHLAEARLGGAWSRRVLRGEGGGDGAPSPVVSRGRVSVAYTQRVRTAGARTQREVFLFTSSGTRRLTVTPGDERDALAADGYVAWTRREPGRGATSAWLEKVR